LKARLKQLLARVDAMSLRERTLIFAAAAVLIFSVIDTLLIQPRFAAAKQMSIETGRRQSELRGLEKQIESMARARERDPDRDKRVLLERLARELAETEKQITEEQARVTSPEQMRSVVDRLLARNRRIALVDLRTLPRSAISDRAAGAAATAGPAPRGGGASKQESLVYRHGLEITVAGSYLDLLAYLSDLEKLPTRIYWGEVALDAAGYPTVVMKLSVYTLSLDKAWMNV